MSSQHLLIIDPQNDFCDLPPSAIPAGEAPALPVAGADADLHRLAKLIDEAGDGLDRITITLDSHHRVDIGHPTFWYGPDRSEVAPFTPIAAAQVRSGDYAPRNPAALPRVLKYLEALEAAGRYVHMVWPIHCEIGTWGHNVHTGLRQAYNRWEAKHLRQVAKVVKGTNPWTEHYSAVQAEVPDPADDATQTNIALITSVGNSGTVYIGGEAGSHCVKATTEHLVNWIAPPDRHKLVLLTDCMSPVTGFESQYREFLAVMQAQGLRLMTAAEATAEIAANAS